METGEFKGVNLLMNGGLCSLSSLQAGDLILKRVEVKMLGVMIDSEEIFWGLT